MIRSIGQGEWRPNISLALALEYEDILKRKNLLPISEEEADEFLNYVFKVSNLVPPPGEFMQALEKANERER